jgi:phage gpG-like protein
VADQFDIHFDEAAARALLESSEGPVARDLIRRGIRVESQAKLNASGRPGPRVQTGRLRSSITWALGRDTRGLFVDVGSNVVYAKRIEEGFHGTDSLGRRYDQPAYPFLRPALIAARD